MRGIPARAVSQRRSMFHRPSHNASGFLDAMQILMSGSADHYRVGRWRPLRLSPTCSCPLLVFQSIHSCERHGPSSKTSRKRHQNVYPSTCCNPITVLKFGSRGVRSITLVHLYWVSAAFLSCTLPLLFTNSELSTVEPLAVLPPCNVS